MRLRLPMPNSASYTLPVVLSVAMHLLLLAAVAWGWEFAAEEQQVVRPRYIEAKFVELKAKTPAQQPPKADKVIDLAAQRAAEEQRRKAEEAQRRAEQQRQAEAQRKKEEAQEKQREQEQLAREKAQQEAEARRQMLEQELTESLQEEDQLLQAEQAEAVAQSYTALIQQRIGQNWSRPPSARTGMKTRLRIELVPTGRVVGVDVVESSGNAAFDRSAEQAVWQAEQFAELKEMDSTVFEQYFRQFTVLFDPQDLRL